MSSARPDPLTLVGIGWSAYSLANLLHEGVGHALTCLLLGGKVQVLTSLYCLWDPESLSEWGTRLVLAGGTLVNLLLGILLLVLLRRFKQASPQTRCFLWLAACINLLQAGGYLMISPFLGWGDWALFLDGLSNVLVWKIVLTLLGINLWIMGFRIGISGAAKLVPPGESDAFSRLAAMVWIPYLSGGLLMTLSHALDPTHNVIGFWAALGTTFCGTFALACIPLFRLKSPSTASDTPPLPNPTSFGRSLNWIGIGLAAALLTLALFGPGLHFHAAP